MPNTDVIQECWGHADCTATRDGGLRELSLWRQIRYGWPRPEGQKPGASRIVADEVAQYFERLKRSGENEGSSAGERRKRPGERRASMGSARERAKRVWVENGLKVFMDDLHFCGAPTAEAPGIYGDGGADASFGNRGERGDSSLWVEACSAGSAALPERRGGWRFCRRTGAKRGKDCSRV